MERNETSTELIPKPESERKSLPYYYIASGANSHVDIRTELAKYFIFIFLFIKRIFKNVIFSFPVLEEKMRSRQIFMK